MILTLDEKVKLYELMLTERKTAILQLFKYKNYDLELIQDKFYIMFNLALLQKKEGNLDIAKTYVNELMMVMKDSDDSMRFDKLNLLWLYIELNKDLTQSELRKTYCEIYENIKYKGEDDESVLAIRGNIHMLDNEYEEVFNILETCLQRRYIGTIESIIEDFSKTNEIYYLKAINLKKKYKDKVSNVN